MSTPSQRPEPNSETRSDRHSRLSAFVSGRVTELARRRNQESAVKASLARLRNSVDQRPEDNPAIWPELYRDFPTDLVSHAEPGSYERAAHSALALFAVHQQSRDESMHKTGVGLGKALQRLASPSDAEEQSTGVMRRYQALVTADEFSEIVHHLRGVVQLLRSESIPLDYGQLAKDLARLHQPHSTSLTRLRWARDFHAPRRKSARDEAATSSSSPTASATGA